MAYAGRPRYAGLRMVFLNTSMYVDTHDTERLAKQPTNPVITVCISLPSGVIASFPFSTKITLVTLLYTTM